MIYVPNIMRIIYAPNCIKLSMFAEATAQNVLIFPVPKRAKSKVAFQLITFVSISRFWPILVCAQV